MRGLLSLVLAIVASVAASDALIMPGLFSDNMVLQRDKPLIIWGHAAANQKVIVSLDKQSITAVSDAQGTWRARLPARKAGGPYTLTVIAGDTLVFRNVMFGDVWICSGQSNMEMGIGFVQNAPQEIAAANYPDIRFFTVRKVSRDTPADTVSGAWRMCTPENISTGGWNGFSAAAYFFGRDLHQSHKVPIGLINASWGGTTAEAWTSISAMRKETALRSIVDRYEEIMRTYPEARKEFVTRLANWDSTKAPKSPSFLPDSGNRGVDSGWAGLLLNDSAWDTMDLPRPLEPRLLIDGAVWFRKKVVIPPALSGKSLYVSLGPVDDFDVTYFNGEQIGKTGEETPGFWAHPRWYVIPERLVKKGSAIIAVRVFDRFGGGGFTGSDEQMRIYSTVGAPISLAGNWKYRVERAVEESAHNPGMRPGEPMGPANPAFPGGLYNGMIAPLQKYACAGVIWYQGESNATEADRYETLLSTMVRDWRRGWGAQLPFYLVQLAGYQAAPKFQMESDWARIREAQAAVAAKVPDCGLATAVDIGDSLDIHPKNKQEIGRRLALIARAKYYHDAIVESGPTYASMKIEGNAIRITFTNRGGGLVAKGDSAPGGFMIAGVDRKFYPASAAINGATVVVSSAKVANPVAVRYAWSDYTGRCNLYSNEGLPALPFRTDSWPFALMGE